MILRKARAERGQLNRDNRPKITDFITPCRVMPAALVPIELIPDGRPRDLDIGIQHLPDSTIKERDVEKGGSSVFVVQLNRDKSL